MQVYQERERREGRGGTGRGRARSRRQETGDKYWGVLLVTAQELHSQGYALVPLPWQDADVSAIEWWLKDVLFVNIVVAVT